MDDREWTHQQWSAICPECGIRRILWPLHQNVSSLEDPKAQFIHLGSGKKDCE